MADEIIYLVYALITLEIALLIGAAIYCFRLTKLTGAFRAWTLLIVAMALVAIANTVQYLNVVLFYSAAKIEAIVSASPLGFIANTAYGLAVAGLLFFAMLELFKTFKRLKRPSPSL